MAKIYLDYAATTPVDPRVKKEMLVYFDRKYGNPGSLHFFGQEAMAAVDLSREKIAKAIGADFREIIFTGSATEANNLALRGAVKSARSLIHGQLPKIILSSIEHESVLETAEYLEKEGAVEAIYLSVTRDGLADLKKLEEALDARTVLVSIIHANNETGSIQPIGEISALLAEWRERQGDSVYPLFHTDAVQAFQYLDCSVKNLGVDLMTISAHKIYGPKGIGALYVRQASGIRHQVSGVRLVEAIITGGGQEFGLRSATENVPCIVGFAKAAEIAMGFREKEAERVSGLRDYFWLGLKRIYPRAELNGRIEVYLPNIINVYFPGISAQDFLTKLDLAGVAASSGSACSSRSFKPSHVLSALGHSEERARGSIRFSLGRHTTKAAIDEVLKRVKIIL